MGIWALNLHFFLESEENEVFRVKYLMVSSPNPELAES